ncbi:hypothetical protein GJ699_03895 [Duganella sp. FT80W]|uniref:Uncharacterized protein n=1 Tax=Duganella guangzhouensis TaxID=2666084 RepID=A0A6I2KYM9_9BURK|nr:hypothetical protein [Duganella guangzhouensis]MRW89119.1 hypothetical protein [Duganella guangzhouensis]
MYKRAYAYFILALLIAIGGFYPSFFGRLGQTDPIRMFHGTMATIWLLMLIVQSWLYAHRRLKLHRLIGRLSLVVVPLFLISGFLVLHDMLSGQQRGFVKAFGTLLGFLDLTSILYFAWTYCMAIANRNRIQLHARYMASTATLLLPPALARLMVGLHFPFVTSFISAVHAAYFATELVVAALLVSDSRNGGIRKPYVILLVFTVLQHLSVLITPGITWLNDAARAFGAL